MFDPPLLVVVTGAPASGKTDVAERLAASLRIPFLVKDTFKETLYDEVGSDDGLEPAIERAGLAILFRVADAQLEAGVSVLTERATSTRAPTPRRSRSSRRARARTWSRSTAAGTRRCCWSGSPSARSAASGHPGLHDEPENVDEIRTDLHAGRWDPLDLPGTLIEFDKDREDEDALIESVRSAAPD